MIAGSRRRTLDTYVDYLQERWQTSSVPIKDLQYELHGQGFTIGYATP
ncbi:hypothetical protein ACIRBZ_42295 [Streptomyces sp. NPDC094038]